MNQKSLIKKIKNTNWYRQGGAISPYYPSVPYRRAFNYFDGFNYYRGHNNYGYFDRDRERKICDSIIQKQLLNRNYIENRLINLWHRQVKKQNAFVRNINTGYLAALSNSDLFRLHGKLTESRDHAWKLSILIEAFDPWGDIIIAEYLTENNLDIKPDDLAVLIGQEKLTFVQQELLECLQIARDFKKGKKVQNRIQNHTKKYFWMSSNWDDIVRLDEKYFERLVENAAKKSSREIDRKIRELSLFKKRNLADKRKLEKKYSLPAKVKNLFYLFSAFSDWRDERKAQLLRINDVADLFLNEIAKRSGVKKNYLVYLDGYEVKSVAYLKKIESQLKKRSAGALYYVYGRTGIRWYTGQKANLLHRLLEKQLIKRSDEIKGMVACPGKIVGEVKRIITKKDFSKMDKGDILVTQMTRPEFMPVVSKAKAIITDEGGLTCHAAIISRELKIPCIIGTQVATSVLKSGDKVEVDAVKGIVKKL